MKQFSIIVPVYNIENYIEYCIESIIRQTFKNYELIIVDDGSVDESANIVDRYKTFKNIKVYHKKNGGLSDARNFGIKHASGQYLMFVDGDDFLYDKYSLEKIANSIKTKPDILQYRMVYYYDKNKKYVHSKNIQQLASNKTLYVLHELNKNSDVSISACDKVVKNQLIKNYKLYFEKGLSSEDLQWSLKLYLKANEVCILDSEIYAYRQQRPNSISSTKTTKKVESLYYIIKCWLNHNYENDLEKDIYLNIISYWYIILRTKYPAKIYPKEIKCNFKKLDNYLLKFDENNKVKKVVKVKRIFGMKITILLLKMYIFLKNKGIMKL